jgi:hypothetical protein
MQWIKCSERMPDVGEQVLIRISCSEHFNIENGRYKGDGLWAGCWFNVYGKKAAPTKFHTGCHFLLHQSSNPPPHFTSGSQSVPGEAQPDFRSNP